MYEVRFSLRKGIAEQRALSERFGAPLCDAEGCAGLRGVA
jgi:hypothetical protein